MNNFFWVLRLRRWLQRPWNQSQLKFALAFVGFIVLATTVATLFDLTAEGGRGRLSPARVITLP